MDGTREIIGNDRLEIEAGETAAAYETLYLELGLDEPDPAWITFVQPLIEANKDLGKRKETFPFTKQTALKVRADQIKKERDEISKITKPLTDLINKDKDAETILKTLKAIPHPTLRRIIDGVDLTKDTAITAVKQINTGLKTIEKELTNQYRFFNTLDKSLKAADYTIKAREKIEPILDKEQKVWRDVETQIAPELAALAAVASGDASVEIDLQPALDAFADRVEARGEFAKDITKVLRDIDAAVDDVVPDGVADAGAWLADRFRDGLAIMDEALDVLRALAIPDVSAVFKPINAALGVLDAVAKVIKPVIDFFGPVTRLINAAFEKVESALGLDTLRDRIKAAVEAAVDRAVDPVKQKIQEILDDLFGALQDAFDRLTELYEELADQLTDLLGPGLADSIDAQEEPTNEIDGASILAGSDDADILRLARVDSYDDGWAGMATGGAGADTITGTDGRDLIFAGEGDDIVVAGDGADQVVAGAGEDEVLGGEGDDEIDGGADDDDLQGNGGSDTVAGGDGADAIKGGAGNDRLLGGEGEDTLRGGAGNDSIEGGSGVDRLEDGEGSNTLDGGDGVDRIVTLGEATARHRIEDASAILEGGAGTDVVAIRSAFAVGTSHDASVSFDGGSGRDELVASNLDLATFGDVFQQIEALRMVSGNAATWRVDAEQIARFESLGFGGAGDKRIEATGAAFDMNALFGPTRVLFDDAGLRTIVNPQDGDKAGRDGFPQTRLYDLTLARADAGRLVALTESAVGFQMAGSDGDDELVGSGASDLLRGGLGADTLDGGPGDGGDRFDLDSAVGDVIAGTLEELDGDTIRNLTNRVDRIRIEGSQEYGIRQIVSDGTVEVRVYEDEAARDADADGADDGTGVLSTFTLEGSYPELTFRSGSYEDADGGTVDYVEVFNNNIPPTAEGERVNTAFVRDGGLSFDPFLNDFDVDTKADEETGVTRRQINFVDSLDALFAIVPDRDDEAALRALADGKLAVTIGQEFVTELGNVIRLEAGPDATQGGRGYQLVYEAREPTVAITKPEGELSYLNNFPLPFFGLDRVSYQVFDLGFELSRKVSLQFLVRPDVVDADGNVIDTPTVTVQSIEADAVAETVEIDLLPVTDSTFGQSREPDGSEPIFDLAEALKGNDYMDVAAIREAFDDGLSDVPPPTLVSGSSGDDVIDARGVEADLYLLGGRGADWLEGGLGDDTLSPGGSSDYAFRNDLRLDRDGAIPADFLPANVLLGGAGRNVFGSSTNFSSGGTIGDALETVHVLDEAGRDVITGPLGPAFSRLTKDIFFGDKTLVTERAMQALDNDTVLGFGDDDAILIPLGLSEVADTQTDRDSYAGLRVDVTSFHALVIRETSSLSATVQDQLRNGTYSETVTGNLTFNSGFSPTLGFTAGGPSHLLTYEIETGANDPTTDRSITEVTVSLDMHTARYRDGSFTAANGKGFGTYDYVRDDRVLGALGLDGAEMTIEMEGRFDADKFTVEWVDVRDPGLGTEPTGEVITTGKQLLPSQYKDSNDYNGLRLTYRDDAPEAMDDAFEIVEGGAASFDLLANDTDREGDDLLIFDLVWESEADRIRLTDGVAENGEVVLQTDQNSGFGTGIVTVAAPESDPDAVIRFGYVVTDGASNSEEATVEIVQVPPPPVVADDFVVLPFSPGLEPVRIPISALVANDEAADGGAAPADTFRLVDMLVPLSIDIEPISVEDGFVVLPRDVVAALASSPTGPDGMGGFAVPFSYTLGEGEGLSRSEEAQVVVRMAGPLDFALPDGFVIPVVREDGTIAIDLTPLRIGGFGDVTFSASVSDAAGNLGGTVEVSETGIVFTPAEDASGGRAIVTVSVRDASGTKVELPIPIEVLPIPDLPELRLTPDGSPLDALQAIEDTPLTGSLFLVDPDPGDGTLLRTLGTLETEEGGEIVLEESDLPGVVTFSYTPAEDFAGRDSIILEVASGDLDVPQLSELSLDILVSPVDDAPRLPGSVELTVDVEGEARFLLLDGATEVDAGQEIDPDSIVVDTASGGSRVDWEILPDEEDGVTLLITGLRPGAVQLGYTIDDEGGLTSAPRVLDITVNAPPETVTDTYTVETIDPIRIDPIANDTDLEGPLSYVREDGVPVIIDPGESFGFELDENGDPVELADAPGLRGTVAWIEERGAFFYRPPQDLDDFGGTDVFFYEVVDESGSVVRESVLIDLLKPGTPELRLTDTDSIQLREEAEVLVAAADGARLTGTLAQFDGDTILAFREGTEILITDAPIGTTEFDVSRAFDDALASLDARRLAEAPTVARLFGGATLDALTGAFVGDTVVGITAPSGSAALTFSGSITGNVRVSGVDGGTLISYRGSTGATDGPDDLGGTDGDDRIDGKRGGDVIDGGPGNDRLIGGAGRDVLSAGPGEDTLTGGDGADLFLLSGDGVTRITDFDPEEGDRIGIEDGRFLADDQTVDPDRVSLVRDGDGWRLDGTPDDGPTEVLARFDIPEPVIRGDDTSERILGTAGADTIEAGGGNDLVDGRGGPDIVRGEDGNDTLIGGDGDALTGGPGADVFAFLAARGGISVKVTDFGAGDVLAIDDQFVGLGSASIDPRGIPAPLALLALERGFLGYDLRNGIATVDADGRGPGAPVLTIDLPDGTRLGLDDVLLF